MYFFFLAWIIRWFLSSSFRAKHFVHIAHLNGFSPVWVKRCFLSVWDQAKLLKQMKHTNGFSLVCVMWCPLRCAECMKDVSQRVQAKILFSSVKYLMLLYMDRIGKIVFTLWAIKIIFFLCCFCCYLSYPPEWKTGYTVWFQPDVGPKVFLKEVESSKTITWFQQDVGPKVFLTEVLT